ncbi:MAG TPA: hypothetical protein VG370_31495 [Chloroflexota bacterium]|jgi:hypothetical protein|nr:hypothetical protein [Chloroflexota bacterium]
MHHVCQHCQREFASPEELRRHREELHADLPLDPEEVRNELVLTTGTQMTGHSGTHPPPGTGGPATP